MIPNRSLHEQNRLSWNAATEAHNSHKGDQAAFFRNGGTTLFPEEIELLGDLQGLSLVHLQCNAGQDTLSLALLGAKVTGVDISDTAIDFAQRLSTDSGIPAQFYRSDVYDWLEQTARGPIRFDVVFSSYGALCWLSDLPAWARGIASILKPGGRIVVIDFHPVWMLFDEEDWTLKYPYFKDEQPLTWKEGVGDYVALSGDGLTPGDQAEGIKDFKNPHPCHEFSLGIGEIVTGLLDAGLVLTTLREYPYSNGYKWKGMRETSGRRMIVPEGIPDLPLMYGMVGKKGRVIHSRRPCGSGARLGG